MDPQFTTTRVEVKIIFHIGSECFLKKKFSVLCFFKIVFYSLTAVIIYHGCNWSSQSHRVSEDYFELNFGHVFEF